MDSCGHWAIMIHVGPARECKGSGGHQRPLKLYNTDFRDSTKSSRRLTWQKTRQKSATVNEEAAASEVNNAVDLEASNDSMQGQDKKDLWRRFWKYMKEAWTGVISGSGR